MAPRRDQGRRLAGACHLKQQTALHEQPAAILAHFVPDPDGLGWVVLPQHPYPPPIACQPLQAGVIGALLHDIAALIALPEQAGIARDLMIIRDLQRVGIEPRELCLQMGWKKLIHIINLP